jgi:hypothetical protein
MENLKEKILKVCENHSIFTIKNACREIYENIENECIYKPKTVLQKSIEIEKVSEDKDTLLKFPKYPINGIWTEKLKFLFNNVINKDSVYTTKEIIQQFIILENKKYKEIAQKVYSVLNYCVDKYPQSYIEEITGNKINKKYRFKHE